MILLAAFALLFVASGVVSVLGRRARRLAPPAASRPDRSSGALLGAAHGVSMIAGAVFPWLGIGRLPWPPAVALAGLGGMAAGIALQIWSMRMLGPLFTLRIQAAEGQTVVARGPYRVVRHPGYLGQIVLWLGFAVTSANAITLAVVAVACGAGYGYRIVVEERTLLETLGADYQRYAANRPRLLPLVW